MYLFIRSGLTWSDYRKVGWLKKTESGSGSSTVCSTTGRPLPLIDSGNDKCSSGVNLLQDLLATKDKLTHAEVRCQSLAAEKERLKSSEARLISENEMLHRNQQTRDQLVISLEAIQVCTSACYQPWSNTGVHVSLLSALKQYRCARQLVISLEAILVCTSACYQSWSNTGVHVSLLPVLKQYRCARQLVISLEAIQVCTSTGVQSAHTALQWVILAVFKLSFCFLHLIFYFGNFCFASYIFNWTFIFCAMQWYAYCSLCRHVVSVCLWKLCKFYNLKMVQIRALLTVAEWQEDTFYQVVPFSLTLNVP